MLWNLANTGITYKCLCIVRICHFLTDRKSNMDTHAAHLYVWHMENVAVFKWPFNLQQKYNYSFCNIIISLFFCNFSLLVCNLWVFYLYFFFVIFSVLPTILFEYSNKKHNIYFYGLYFKWELLIKTDSRVVKMSRVVYFLSFCKHRIKDHVMLFAWWDICKVHQIWNGRGNWRRTSRFIFNL